MKYYHATSVTAAESIKADGLIKKSIEGFVYCADSVDNAVKFLALRCMGEPIYVFEFDVPEGAEVEEQFDHNEAFFKCKAYGVYSDVPADNWTNIYVSTPN